MPGDTKRKTTGRGADFLLADSEIVSGTRAHLCPEGAPRASRASRDTVRQDPLGPSAPRRRSGERKTGRKELPPVTLPPSGRYSSQSSIHVDEVGVTKVVARRNGPPGVKPTVTDRVRLLRTPLDTREVSLLSFIDGTLTVPELVAATAIPEAAILTMLARFVRLGFVSLSS